MATQYAQPTSARAAATQTVEQVHVHPLLAPAVEGAAPVVPGYFYRHDWGNWNGQAILTLNWNVITDDSLVFVSIGEGLPGAGKFVGGSRYTLHNVAPAAGHVAIWVEIEWSYPIRLYVDYLVVTF